MCSIAFSDIIHQWWPTTPLTAEMPVLLIAYVSKTSYHPKSMPRLNATHKIVECLFALSVDLLIRALKNKIYRIA